MAGLSLKNVSSLSNDWGPLLSAMYGTKDEQKLAKRKLKALYLKQFKSECKPGEEYFGEFYKAVKIINSALSGEK